MQLTMIKIAGFKSFVDPTTITLPSHLVAIVGPNGCGKSNIIDAVTWVMGESSPKYLRGDALTDVIFNGSSVRKPIGQASVELVFDNTDASIGGEYAKFAEISIKRMINRESDSTYYLNGVRCRKRDVSDIFFGTGLGPRSYSIVGQNMISRISESKPEELRSYIEEAAGISKYKERRHETELRIQHTKDNLARINDLRTELDKQLSNLKHQANVAEKFKSFKQQERVLRAECFAIQWRMLDKKMVDYTLLINREGTALEARNSLLSSTDREIEQTRHEQRMVQDAFQEIQRRYYAVGNEITRIEQEILHQQERKNQWENDLNQIENDWESIKELVSESEDNLRDFEHDVQHLEPALISSKKEFSFLSSELQQAEERMQAWQAKWDEFQHTSAKTNQIAQIEKTQVQHLEQQIVLLDNRQRQIDKEQSEYNFTSLESEIKALTLQTREVTEKLNTQNKELQAGREKIDILKSEQKEANAILDKVRIEGQTLYGQQASLLALQQTALGQRNNTTVAWVAAHHLSEKPRLAQNIEVEKGWEFAVEKAMGNNLQAICIEEINEVISHSRDFKDGNICFFTSLPNQNLLQNEERNKNVAEVKADKTNAKKKGILLIEKIKSSWNLQPLLFGIYAANSLEEALLLCESLDTDESVITPDGMWLNQAWIKILREADPAVGIFEREQELKALSQKLSAVHTKKIELEKRIATYREQINQLEKQQEQLQQNYNQQNTQLAHLEAQQKMKQERVKDLTLQFERFKREQATYKLQLEKNNAELIKAKQQCEQALTNVDQLASMREALMTERDQVREALLENKNNTVQHKEKMHELEIRLQTAKSQIASIKHTLARLQAQQASLNERKITLQSELSSMPPLDTIKKSLSRALDKHVNTEAELNTTRVSVEALEHEFHNLENKRQTIERDIAKIRTTLEGLRVEWQGWKVKTESICEQIKETDFKLEDILKDLAQDITAEEWQTKIDQLVQRINRLGSINLIAIEEYATCLKRKEYLDKQVDDLQSGLSTLEDAILKIDKETKTRFKENFDKVNTHFQGLFPTIFGGGKAYLELTGDDLLTAGVSMMACPPGKRNSSIYLLSGGEKSLIAIALIFSIFQLNPAPFCLLDEVDAALDDANVLRFTRLVKTMADKIQFIFISHNKITIEMAEHLIGVTMNEPGVSRLVSVDIEKAMDLVGA